MTDQEADDYIKTLLLHFAAKLTEWEDGFVRNLKEVRANGRSLSPRQALKLNDVMERCAAQHGRSWSE